MFCSTLHDFCEMAFNCCCCLRSGGDAGEQDNGKGQNDVFDTFHDVKFCGE